MQTPPFVAGDPVALVLLAGGLAALGGGTVVYLAGCVRLALRGDWLAAVLLEAGALPITLGTVFGRQALRHLVGQGGWVSYHLPFIGQVSHLDVCWVGDDGLVWCLVGAALGLLGAGLVAMPSHKGEMT